MAEETEKQDSEVLVFGFADNSLQEPVECIRHVFTELMKVGHTVRIYTYHRDKALNMQALNDFMTELNIPGLVVEDWNEVLADVYYDARTFNGATGMWVLYGALLRGELVGGMQHNVEILQDQGFWQTGKRSSGIKTNGPKIMGLDGSDLTSKSNG